MNYAQAAESAVQQPAAKAKPIKRKNVALAKMATLLATDETPTQAALFTALYHGWTREHPNAGFPEINIVWLHISKAFRVEFRYEEDYLHALVLEFAWGAQPFHLEPSSPPYLSVRFHGI